MKPNPPRNNDRDQSRLLLFFFFFVSSLLRYFITSLLRYLVASFLPYSVTSFLPPFARPFPSYTSPPCVASSLSSSFSARSPPLNRSHLLPSPAKSNSIVRAPPSPPKPTLSTSPQRTHPPKNGPSSTPSIPPRAAIVPSTLSRPAPKNTDTSSRRPTTPATAPGLPKSKPPRPSPTILAHFSPSTTTASISQDYRVAPA